jgi:hypothetical protein
MGAFWLGWAALLDDEARIAARWQPHQTTKEHRHHHRHDKSSSDGTQKYAAIPSRISSREENIVGGFGMGTVRCGETVLRSAFVRTALQSGWFIILYIPHHREKHSRAKIALETALSPSTKQIIMIGKGRYAQLRDVLLLHSRDPHTQGALRDPLAYHGRTLEMEDPPRPGDLSRHS